MATRASASREAFLGVALAGVFLVCAGAALSGPAQSEGGLAGAGQCVGCEPAAQEHMLLQVSRPKLALTAQEGEVLSNLARDVNPVTSTLPPGGPAIGPKELQAHTSNGDCWAAVDGVVYDFGPWVKEGVHRFSVVDKCGQDISDIWRNFHATSTLPTDRVKGTLSPASLVETWHDDASESASESAMRSFQEREEAATPTGCRQPSWQEPCNAHVIWAMTTGIREHADWYPGLSKQSPYGAFQALVHSLDNTRCPAPCSLDDQGPGDVAGGKGRESECRTAVPGDWCYGEIDWAMREGIYAHPEWYPASLTPASSRAEFQQTLFDQKHTGCGRPCSTSTTPGSPPETSRQAGPSSTEAEVTTTAAEETTTEEEEVTTTAAEESTEQVSTTAAGETTTKEEEEVTTTAAEETTTEEEEVTTTAAEGTTTEEEEVTTTADESISTEEVSTTATATSDEVTTTIMETTSTKEVSTTAAEATSTEEVTTTAAEATSTEEVTTTATEATSTEEVTTTAAEATSTEEVITTAAEVTSTEEVTTTAVQATTTEQVTTTVAEATSTEEVTTTAVETTPTDEATTAAATTVPPTTIATEATTASTTAAPTTATTQVSTTATATTKVTTTTVAATTTTTTLSALAAQFERTAVATSKSCRGANKTDNLASYYKTLPLNNLTLCEEQCIATQGCTGVEFWPNHARCEIWKEPILAKANSPGFFCYRRLSMIKASPTVLAQEQQDHAMLQARVTRGRTPAAAPAQGKQDGKGEAGCQIHCAGGAAPALADQPPVCRPC